MKFHGKKSRRLPVLGPVLALLLTALLALPALASPAPADQPGAVLAQAHNLIEANQTNRDKLHEAISLLEGCSAQMPGEIKVPLYLAEAYYRLADPEADVSREFPVYEKAGMYAQKALDINPNSPEAHYWYGLFLLKSAQKKGGPGAYFMAKNGIKELEKVRAAMPAYDHAGASRVLGLLYCLAPQWTPFGNLDKSIAMGQEATRLAPDYALNRFYLANAYNKKGDKNAAMQEYQTLLATCGKGRDDLSTRICQKAKTELATLAQN